MDLGKFNKCKGNLAQNGNLCRQPVNIGNTHKVAFNKIATIPTFEFTMYHFPPVLRRLKSHNDQAICKWVDACSIMSNVAIVYDPTRKIYLLDNLDAKNLDEFVGNL